MLWYIIFTGLFDLIYLNEDKMVAGTLFGNAFILLIMGDINIRFCAYY